MAKINTLMSDIPALKNAIDNTISDYVKTPTTNTTWSSDSNNNPYGLFFDDCTPRFGVERIMFAGLEAIPVEDGQANDSNGRQGFYPINAETGIVDKRIRFYGNWGWNALIDLGYWAYSNTSADYVVVTGIFNKINCLMLHNPTYGVMSNYLNGVDTTFNTSPTGSNVLNAKNYSPNVITTSNIGSISTGLNTVKFLKDDSNGNHFSGIELISEQYDDTHNIHVSAGTMVVSGEELTFPAFVGSSALNYKGVLNATLGSEIYSGTKGGRIAWYPYKNPTTGLGTWLSKVTSVEEQVQSGAIAYNGGSDDGITGLTDSSKYYANSQGNIVRVKDATSADRMLLVPTAAPSGTTLTFSKKYEGTASTSVFSNGDQFEDDGTSTSTFADLEACTLELYGKCFANANFSNSELVREIHWREMGAGRSDDLSTATTGATTRAFTLDEGTITVAGTNLVENAGTIGPSATNDYINITFIGSGFEYFDSNNLRLWTKVISDLPCSTHNIRIFRDSAGANDGLIYVDGIYIGRGKRVYFSTFRIYQPKTPTLTGYKPAWATNLLANFIATNLPTYITPNGTKYVGQIDQGVLRKSGHREFIHTGSGWVYGVDPGTVSANCTASPNNGDSATATIFGNTNFRAWSGFTTLKSISLSIDGGSSSALFAAGSTSPSGKFRNTLGSLGVHTVTLIGGSEGGSYIEFSAIDYYTPTYESNQWKTNPYLDYLIGSNSIISQLQVGKDALIDIPRQYKTISTIASGVTVPTTEMLLNTIVLDKGTWELSSVIPVNKTASTSNSFYVKYYVDGVAQEGAEVLITAQFEREPKYYKFNVTLSKKSAITITCYTDSGSSYNIYYGFVNSKPASIVARKISN